MAVSLAAAGRDKQPYILCHSQASCLLQNYMAATADDVYTWCTQKLHPALDGAFQAAGVPITTFREDRIVTGKPAT